MQKDKKDKKNKEYKQWEKNPTISKSRNKNNIKQEHNKKQSIQEYKKIVAPIMSQSVWNKGSSSIISPKEKQKKIKNCKSPPKCPKVIIPARDTRNYAAIIKPEINIEKNTFISNTTTKNDVSVPITRIIRRKCVTNYTPKSGSRISSHVNWELAHYKCLLELYDIFMDGMYKLDPNFDDNVDTFYNFTDFVHHVSSTNISPYLEDLTQTHEDEYTLYTIKRQDFL